MKPDTQGIDALLDVSDDNVLSPVVWEQMLAELGDVPPTPQIDPFDEQPWLALPTMDDLDGIWAASPLDSLIHRLAIAAHGDGPDLMKFMAQQRERAELELAWIEEVRHADYGAGSVEHGPIAAAEAGGGGGDFSGGSEDGEPVVQGGQAASSPDAGGAPPVLRKRRAGKAAGRGF